MTKPPPIIVTYEFPCKLLHIAIIQVKGPSDLREFSCFITIQLMLLLIGLAQFS